MPKSVLSSSVFALPLPIFIPSLSKSPQLQAGLRVWAGLMLSGVMLMNLTGCEQARVDSPAPSLDATASVPHPAHSIASSVRSISTHIATTVMSPDAVKVVHEIVMPTNVPVTLTAYQEAYLSSVQLGRQDREQARLSNDADVIFARSMIAHHLAAIRMANIELEYGTDNDMRKLAKDIVFNKQNEISLFQNWVGTHSDSPAPNGQLLEQQTADIREEFADGLDDMANQMMLGIMSQNPDIAFAQAMLPHHKGALAMAQVELRYGDDDKVRHLADNIIDTQESEIQLMQQWLRQQTLAKTAP